MARHADGHAKLVGETLNFIVERSWQLSGHEFFSELAMFIGKALEVDFVICAAISRDDATMVDTLSFYSEGDFSPDFSYSIINTPCEKIVGQNFCAFREGIQERFPADHMLQEIGVDSYAGIPLWAPNGQPLGLINIMDRRPLEQIDLVRTVLQIVSTRAAAELERQGTTAMLQWSEKRFSDFASISSDFFWESDADLRFSFFSDQFENVTGVAPEQLLGKTRAQVGAPGADPDAYRQLLRDLEAHRPFRDFEHTRALTGDDTVYLAISGSPTFDENGEFLGYRGAGRNISRYRLAQREATKSCDAAERANQAKSEFLASMSHELRTPLNAIIGFAQFLQHDPTQELSERQSEQVGHIVQAGGHLLQLVDEILDLSRIEANELDLHFESVPIVEVLDECIGLTRGLREPGQIQLIQTYDALGNIFVYADRLRLRQILINLLSNAIKFNINNGQVKVGGRVNPDGFVCVEIVDTGIGIPSQHQGRVFDLFHRIGAEAVKTREGTGIGLTVSKFLIEQMGGRIGFDSREGEGSTFWIELSQDLPRKNAAAR